MLVKAALYATTFAAAGGALFLCYNRAAIEQAERRTIGRWLEVLLVAAAAASALRILVNAASLSGDVSGMLDSSLIHLVWQSGESSAAITRIAGLLLCVRAVLTVRPSTALAAAGGASAAMSFAWVGHAQASGAAWTAAGMAWPRAGAAFWGGARGPLALSARHGNARRAGAAAARFGALALAAVAMLVAAGLVVLFRLLGDGPAPWSSLWGSLMCVKLVFVAGLLSLAAFNKLRLTPRLLNGDDAALGGLRRSIQAEIALAALVLLATAALTTLSGPPALA